MYLTKFSKLILFTQQGKNIFAKNLEQWKKNYLNYE